MRARGLESAEAKVAWTHLVEVYWIPLYWFARSKGKSKEDAQDLTQSFFLDIMKADGLAKIDSKKGRLRMFLLAAFKHHMFSEWKMDMAAKRGKNATFQLDFERAEKMFKEYQDDETPERVYEKKWAITLMEESLRALRQEYNQSGQVELFEKLQCHLMERSRGVNASLAADLGMSEGHLRLALFRIRSQYRDLLRQSVLDTLADPRDVDGELQYILGLFSS